MMNWFNLMAQFNYHNSEIFESPVTSYLLHIPTILLLFTSVEAIVFSFIMKLSIQYLCQFSSVLYKLSK